MSKATAIAVMFTFLGLACFNEFMRPNPQTLELDLIGDASDNTCDYLGQTNSVPYPDDYMSVMGMDPDRDVDPAVAEGRPEPNADVDEPEVVGGIDEVKPVSHKSQSAAPRSLDKILKN